MLIRNLEYQVESKRGIVEPFVVHTPRELIVGQIVLIMFFVIAILLRAMA